MSPHSDDGVLSLGAAIASWVRRGARVELLTVFALDPTSTAAADGWDSRGGFATEAEAARGRRAEDVAACAILGVSPSWLPFGSCDYDRHGDETAVRDAVDAAVAGSDAMLLPGSPLIHPDHAWLGPVLAAGRSGSPRLGLYVEHPYARMVDRKSEVPPVLEATLGATPVFGSISVSVRDRIAKWKAIRQYRTQLPLMGMKGSLRGGPHSLIYGERLAWIDP